jgi:all-trans-retinol 13,14-reductase
MTGNRCVIIGSGLGGLSCGLILAKNGYEVTILEQDSQIGGCLQCFHRNGIKFETGMHFIGSADKGQTLYNLSNYFGIIDDIVLDRLDPVGYNVVSLHGNEFKFANGKEPFVDVMSSYFPDSKDDLYRYYELIERVAAASSLHSLKQSESNIATTAEYQMRSINDVLCEVIHNPLLREVLVGYLPLYAAEKDKTPFSTHAFISDFYNLSAFRVVGGSDVIASSLAKQIGKYGGNILTRKHVSKIICDDEKATGVIVDDDAFIHADIVISDIHPVRALELIDSKLIRPIFRNRINKIRNTTSCFSVYLHFKKDMVPYMNYNYFGYKDSPWDCEQYSDANWPKGYLYMHFCHENNPKFAESGVIISYMSIKDVERWTDTRIGHRGDDYESFKRRKAEVLLQEIEKKFPGLSACIDNYYTSSPLTYRDYTGTPNGSMYGLAKDVSLGASCHVPFKTKIPNLIFAGQNINSHGMLGVLVGTMIVCSNLIGEDNLFRQIREANK